MPIPFVKSTKDFDDYISKNKYLVANFTASWCQPCQQIKPIMDQLYSDSNGVYDKIEFNRVDLDSQRELASRYSVSSIPTFIFFEGGKEISRVSGANFPNVVQSLNQLKEKASKDLTARRYGNGNSAKSLPTNPIYESVSKFIPKGFEILNHNIHYGQFEALNVLPLYNGSEDSDIKNLFKIDYKNNSTVFSDADSQLLFHVPLMNISKIYSILLKLKDGKEIAAEGELELDEDELSSESQFPNLIKVWANQTLSFDEASNDKNAPYSEGINGTDGWYECKLKFVRFQNVQSLSIFIDGADEDNHTLIEKIIIVGINGESKEQGKINKLEDE